MHLHLTIKKFLNIVELSHNSPLLSKKIDSYPRASSKSNFIDTGNRLIRFVFNLHKFVIEVKIYSENNQVFLQE